MNFSVKNIIIVVVALGIIVAAWYLASPLFIDKTINDEFPLIQMSGGEYNQMKSDMEKMGITPPSFEEMKEMSKEEVEMFEETILEKMADMPKEMQEEMLRQSGEPELLFKGAFMDADSFHKGSGDAFVYQLSDGSHFLRLQDFQVTNGPDLRVLLVASPAPKTSGEVQENYIELARLKGNLGNQNYEIPSGIDISMYKSVVIYCKPFHVIFSVATLNPTN